MALPPPPPACILYGFRSREGTVYDLQSVRGRGGKECLRKGGGEIPISLSMREKKTCKFPGSKYNPPHLNYCPLETSFLPPFSLSLPPPFSSFADSPKRGERQRKKIREERGKESRQQQLLNSRVPGVLARLSTQGRGRERRKKERKKERKLRVGHRPRLPPLLFSVISAS